MGEEVLRSRVPLFRVVVGLPWDSVTLGIYTDSALSGVDLEFWREAGV